MNKISKRVISVLVPCLALLWISMPAGATVTATPATGGAAISADTAAAAPGTGAWTTLTGPVLSESQVGDIGTGTIILNAPAGYEFNPGAGTTVRVDWLGGGNGASNRNINDVASGTAIAVAVTATQITFTVTASTAQGANNSLTWQNVQVRPTQGCPIAASGDITLSGTSAINGTVGVLGTLTELLGTSANIYTVLTGQAYGGCSAKVTGTPVNPMGFGGTPFSLGSLRVTDRFGNLVAYNTTTTVSYVLSSSSIAVTPNPVTFSGGISAALTATVPLANTYTVTASAPGLAGVASASFVIVGGTAAVTVAATGGVSLSADTAAAAPGTGTFTTLAGPVIEESNIAGMAIGAYTLTAPAGYQFDTAGSVTITVGAASGAGTNLVLASTSVTPTAGTITFNVTAISTGARLSSLSFSNVRVRPAQGCPLAASGNIVFASGTALTSVTNSNAGALSEVIGAAADIYTVLSGQAYGGCVAKVTGTPDNPLGQANTPFNLGSLRVTDRFGNVAAGFNSSIAVTYTLAPGSPGSSFTSPVTFNAGVSTTALTSAITVAGNYTVSTSSTGLSGITSSGFTIAAVISILRAGYHLDESGWIGGVDEVQDDSGNALHGSAAGGVSTTEINPAITGNPGTCRYGWFDGIDDYLLFDDDPLLDITTSLTVSAWINPDTLPASGLMTVLSKDANYEFHLKPGGTVNWWWTNAASQVREFDSTAAVSASDASGPYGNGWHHVAIVYSQAGQTIYINGLASGTAPYAGESLLATAEPLRIGADVGPARFFDGLIDEVRIYDGAMSAGEITTLMNETHPCTVLAVDHYAISFPGGAGASTCAPAAVQFDAHNAGHGVVQAMAGLQVTMAASAGNWGSLLAGGGAWSNGGGAVETYTWPGGESVFQVELGLAAAGTSTVDLVDTFGKTEAATEDPAVNFADTSLRVTDAAGVNAVSIGTQIAGKRSDDPPAPQAGQLYLQAFGCSATIAGINNLNMAFECDNPTLCTANRVSVLDGSGTMVPIDGYGDGAATPSTPLGLNFTGDLAPLVFSYPDAGRISLRMSADVTVCRNPPCTQTRTTTYTGASNEFVVRPFGLSIEDSATDAIVQAADATGPAFRKAGEVFNLDVRAVAWDAADDADDDGIPDAGADLGDNAGTPNFGAQATATADITHSLALPASPGDPGSLSGGSGIGGFVNGTATAALSFDEVGIIHLAAGSADYLGQADADVSGALLNLGRFHPHRFTVSANTPAFADSCTAGSTAFTYQDQNFYYATAPVLTVTALNVNGAVTENYGGAGAERFWKLGASLDRSFVDQSAGAGVSHNLNQLADVDVVLAGDGDFDGNGTLTLDSGNGGDIFMYARVSPETEFDAEVDIVFSSADFMDSDGVCHDPDDDGACDAYTLAGIGGALMRFGRLVIGNNFGSELLPLDLEFQAQYFDGTGFVRNTDDDCTIIDDLDLNAVPDLQLSNTLESSVTGTIQVCPGGTSTLTLAGNPLAGGDAGLIFSPPDAGAGCTGNINVTLDLPAMSLGHLLSDSDADGAYDDNPAGRVSFGIYKGSEEMIYIREPW